VLRVETLPPGWLGKCHACAQGAAAAATPWLLFSDADIHMQPDLVARAVATAERDGAVHLTLLPGVTTQGSLSQGIMLSWGLCLFAFSKPASINRDWPYGAMGVGAFNLLRREAYEAFGGHERLRMEVVDDLKLGLLVRRGGGRQRVYAGQRELSCQWAQGVWGLVRLTEKNWFAGLNFNLLFALAAIAIIGGSCALSLIGPAIDPLWGSLALASWLSMIAPALVHARDYDWPWTSALWAPLGMIVFTIGGVNSVWRTLRAGGVWWRDTFYSLEELRAGVVR
jgi:hypothetical protein